MSDEVVKELGKAARGGALALIGMIVAAVFGFLVRAIIGRAYGPAEYGTYSLAFTVFSIAIVFVRLGFPLGLQRQVSYYLTKMPERVHELISTAIVTVTISSVIGALVVIAVRNYLPGIIGGDGLLSRLLLVFGLTIIPAGIFVILIPISQGFKRVREYIVYTKLFVPLMYFSLVLVVTWGMGLGIEYVAVSYLVVQVLGLTLLTRDLFRAGILPRTVTFSPSLAKTLVLFSAPLMVSNIVGFIMTWTDTLMLGHYLGSTVVGIYNAAAPMARFIPVFLSAFTVIYSPIVTSMYARGKLVEVNRFYKAITKWIVLLTFPLFLILFAYPKPTITALFGKEYAEAWLPMMILSVGFMFHSAVGPNGLTLVSIGKPTEEMKGNIIGAVLNVIINFLLIPKYGMSGAAIATATSYIVANTYKQWVLLREGINPFGRRYLQVIGVGILVTAVALLLKASTIYTALLWVALLSMSFYVLTLILGAFDETDVELLKMVSRKFNLNLEGIIRMVNRFSR